jgi:hypothetical protein
MQQQRKFIAATATTKKNKNFTKSLLKFRKVMHINSMVN